MQRTRAVFLKQVFIRIEAMFKTQEGSNVFKKKVLNNHHNVSFHNFNQSISILGSTEKRTLYTDPLNHAPTAILPCCCVAK